MALLPARTRNPQPSTVLGRLATNAFGIDLRSLAAFRIGAAVIVLLDLWYRSRELSAYLTDDGVLPRVARIELFEFGNTFGFEHCWSLHLWSGTFWSQLVLLLVAAWFAIWLLVGYRTQLALFATWLLLLSLDGRNPMILDSGDVLFRSMLLWSFFLPLGGCWSIDAASIGPSERPAGRRVVSIASAALLLQLCLMYWLSVGFKLQPLGDEPSPWLDDFSAAHYALHCDEYATQLGIWLRQFPSLLPLLTGFTVWLEVCGPLLALSPFLSKWLRGGAVVTFVSFHVGLGLSLAIGLFAGICVVCWLLFVPGEFWDWCSVRLRSRRRVENGDGAGNARVRAEQRAAWLTRWFPQPAVPDLRRHWWREGLVCLVFAYTVVWNVRELDFRQREWLLPREWNGIGRALGLDQNWSMFAPKPRTEDGWLVMRGTLNDGTEVNLWRFDEPIPWDKPELVSAEFVSQRWRKYLDNLTIDHYAAQRLYFCDWLARRWNEQQARGQAERQVDKVELIHRLEITPPPGQPIPEAETLILWTYYPLT